MKYSINRSSTDLSRGRIGRGKGGPGGGRTTVIPAHGQSVCISSVLNLHEYPTFDYVGWTRRTASGI